MLASPVDKDDLEPFARDEARLREDRRRDVADIPAGAVLAREMLAAKKPGTGIPAARLAEVRRPDARASTSPPTPCSTEDALA